MRYLRMSELKGDELPNLFEIVVDGLSEREMTVKLLMVKSITTILTLRMV